MPNAKLFVTDQKGAGKTWALRHVGGALEKQGTEVVRAAQGPEYRQRLDAIVATNQLRDPVDFAPLNANLVVEYVSEEDPVGYDVLPVLKRHVVRWMAQDASASAPR